ncbi:hypothetical protein CL653_03380 [bacterium]|nr:hypothetical protein [bacterium]|tara:strand:- start:457 stop:906 length:450 start_codon:yes stop_codon:yes gene_type:complete
MLDDLYQRGQEALTEIMLRDVSPRNENLPTEIQASIGFHYLFNRDFETVCRDILKNGIWVFKAPFDQSLDNKNELLILDIEKDADRLISLQTGLEKISPYLFLGKISYRIKCKSDEEAGCYKSYIAGIRKDTQINNLMLVEDFMKMIRL